MSSRTQVANHLAQTLLNGGDRKQATLEAAAWLKTHGRTRQAEYLARDVAQALYENGYLFAKITTARPITADTKQVIESYLRTSTSLNTIECEYAVDQKLIGGLVIETPHGTLDSSVKARLAKIVEGVSR